MERAPMHPRATMTGRRPAHAQPTLPELYLGGAGLHTSSLEAVCGAVCACARDAVRAARQRDAQLRAARPAWYAHAPPHPGSAMHLQHGIRGTRHQVDILDPSSISSTAMHTAATRAIPLIAECMPWDPHAPATPACCKPHVRAASQGGKQLATRVHKLRLAKLPKYMLVNLGGGYWEYAHRLLLWCWLGPPPHGTEAVHLCNNPACLNPTHLTWVSDAGAAAACLEGCGMQGEGHACRKISGTVTNK